MSDRTTDVPLAIVQDILRDLHDRRGIGHALDSIDSDIRQELVLELREIVVRRLKKPHVSQLLDAMTLIVNSTNEELTSLDTAVGLDQLTYLLETVERTARAALRARF